MGWVFVARAISWTGIIRVARRRGHAKYPAEMEKYEPSLTLAFKMARLFEQPIEAIFTPEAERSSGSA